MTSRFFPALRWANVPVANIVVMGVSLALVTGDVSARSDSESSFSGFAILNKSRLRGHGQKPMTCGLDYANLDPCPPGSNKGEPQTDWIPIAKKACAGPCNGYATLQWTAVDGAAKNVIKQRNHGSLISPNNAIPKSADDLRCWFLPEFSWGMQNPGPAPPFNPQPEVAYLDDAGNSLGGGLPGPDTKVGCCCQEECTMEMIELRHWIGKPTSCGGVDINYNTNGNNGRVLLTRTSDRNNELLNTKHESCMCGGRTPQEQPPFYYYVVQGPSSSTASQDTLLQWLDSLRTAYNNIFDIWSQQPPCSGECVIMGGASDAWLTYDQSTSRSILFQLRAFAAFDPHALPRACGSKGVMLRFGGMTLGTDNVVNCQGLNGWGETGASCKVLTLLPGDFYQIVTLPEDSDFLDQAGSPSEMRLETDRAVTTISLAKGVEVWEKKTCSAPKPSLNLNWRCANHGGVSDNATCLGLLPAQPSRLSLDINQEFI